MRVCATSSFLMMTSFLRILMAYKWLVAFSRHRITLPKVPLPRTLMNSKFSNVWRAKIRKEQQAHKRKTLWTWYINPYIIPYIWSLPPPSKNYANEGV